MSTVAPRSLQAFVAALLVAGGADEREAQTVARVLTWADERQRYPQGSVWTDNLLARMGAGTLRSPARLVEQAAAPAVTRLDAGGGFGQVAATAAMTAAANRAAELGVGVSVVVDSHHFGAAGYYAAELAERGLVGLAMTNAYRKVAAHGGQQAVLGTNPMAFSAPSAGEPVVADLSTGAIAGSRAVREAIDRGKSLEPGMALDAEGRPTVDPVALEAGGSMLPAAGAKGFALGLMVEVLTAALGGGVLGADVGSMFDLSRSAGVSHVVIAVRPLDDGFADRVGTLLAQVLAADGPDSSVRIPGALGPARAAAAAAHGIDLPESTVERLRARAAELHVELPADWL